MLFTSMGEREGEFMMNSFRVCKSFMFFAAIFSMSAWLSGCTVEQETAASSGDGSGDSDDGETTNIPSTATFNILVNTNSNYDIYISKNGDGTTACSATAGQDVLCIIDMHELDMYFRGYVINDALPSDLCMYRGFFPYIYNIAPVGVAPGAVFYEEDADGVLMVPATSPPAGTFSNAARSGLSAGAARTADIYYNIAGYWYTHAELYGAAATSADDIRCPFDYTDVIDDGKNCCTGNYDLLVRSDGKVTNTQPAWGGSLANCFQGPGLDEYDHFASDDLPSYLISNVDTTSGLNSSFTVTAPIEKTGIGQPQVYAANYYKASEHNNVTAWGALTPGDDDVPGPMQVIRDYRGVGSSAHFLYECLDSNFEVIARIRVVAREWNELAELESLISTGSGDADTEGLETDPTNSESDSVSEPTSCKNDHADWKDIEEATNAAACTLDNYGVTYRGFGLANLASVYQDIGTDTVTLLSVMIPYNHSHYLGNFAQ